jgi:hypothetical protein
MDRARRREWLVLLDPRFWLLLGLSLLWLFIPVLVVAIPIGWWLGRTAYKVAFLVGVIAAAILNRRRGVHDARQRLLTAAGQKMRFPMLRSNSQQESD